ncbi:MAG TPA: hypothetical protein DCM87_17725, partial [Planctomycetes bacterium]|nr:hypothetical protein [Planctomycetota bacterium]
MRTWMCAAALAIGCVSAQGQEPYLIADLDRRTPSDPGEAVRLGARFLFHAGIAGAEYGRELWVTDGSPAGTRLVRDINPGPASSVEDRGNQIAAGNVMFFAADDGVSGRELWVSDGTDEGTRLVRDIAPGAAGSAPLEFVLAGERCFLTADDGVNGRELWVSDGTVEGTRLLRDIAPGPSGSNPYKAIVWSDRLFFAADDGVHGREPWVSDGTEAGTFLLADVLPGAGGGRPTWGSAFAERLFFTADDGERGRQLWVTDGTAAGTRLFVDVSPFRAADLTGEACRLYAHAGLLFFSGDNGVSDTALWCTDGTAEETRLLRTFAYGTWVPTIPSLLGSIGERVLFYAGEGDSDRALWISDGTAEGTYPLADICRWGGRYPAVCAAAGDKVYFSGACDPYDTLWVSDGTPDGTLCLSSSMSAPEAFTPFGGQFYFSAWVAGSGRELCVCDGTEAGTG